MVLFSNELKKWLNSPGKKTLGELDEVFGTRSFAVAVLVLMAPSALPIPTGGITHIFELIVVFLAIGLIAGRRNLWLPRGLDKRPVGKLLEEKALPKLESFIRWFERHSRRRLSKLMNKRWFLSLLGTIILVFTVGTLLAPPFSGLDTLPALGIVLICLAILLSDIALAIGGTLIGIVGVVLVITLGRAALHLLF